MAKKVDLNKNKAKAQAIHAAFLANTKAVGEAKSSFEREQKTLFQETDKAIYQEDKKLAQLVKELSKVSDKSEGSKEKRQELTLEIQETKARVKSLESLKVKLDSSAVLVDKILSKLSDDTSGKSARLLAEQIGIMGKINKEVSETLGKDIDTDIEDVVHRLKSVFDEKQLEEFQASMKRMESFLDIGRKTGATGSLLGLLSTSLFGPLGSAVSEALDFESKFESLFRKEEPKEEERARKTHESLKAVMEKQGYNSEEISEILSKVTDVEEIQIEGNKSLTSKLKGLGRETKGLTGWIMVLARFLSPAALVPLFGKAVLGALTGGAVLTFFRTHLPKIIIGALTRYPKTAALLAAVAVIHRIYNTLRNRWGSGEFKDASVEIQAGFAGMSVEDFQALPEEEREKLITSISRQGSTFDMVEGYLGMPMLGYRSKAKRIDIAGATGIAEQLTDEDPEKYAILAKAANATKTRLPLLLQYYDKGKDDELGATQDIIEQARAYGVADLSTPYNRAIVRALQVRKYHEYGAWSDDVPHMQTVGVWPNGVPYLVEEESVQTPATVEPVKNHGLSQIGPRAVTTGAKTDPNATTNAPLDPTPLTALSAATGGIKGPEDMENIPMLPVEQLMRAFLSSEI